MEKLLHELVPRITAVLAEPDAAEPEAAEAQPEVDDGDSQSPEDRAK